MPCASRHCSRNLSRPPKANKGSPTRLRFVHPLPQVFLCLRFDVILEFLRQFAFCAAFRQHLPQSKCNTP
jgi:hypothetical protein